MSASQNNIIRACSGSVRNALIGVHLQHGDAIGAAVNRRSMWEFAELLTEYIGREKTSTFLYAMSDHFAVNGPVQFSLLDPEPPASSENKSGGLKYRGWIYQAAIIAAFALGLLAGYGQ